MAVAASANGIAVTGPFEKTALFRGATGIQLVIGKINLLAAGSTFVFV